MGGHAGTLGSLDRGWHACGGAGHLGRCPLGAPERGVPARALSARLSSLGSAVQDAEDGVGPSPSQRTQSLRWRHLAGGTPHPELDAEGLAETVSTSHAEIVDLASRVVHPENGTVILISDVPPELAQGAVTASRLTSWQRPPLPPAADPTAWSPPGERSVYVIDDPTATAQAQISLSCHVAQGGLAMQITEILLESRLNRELRSELGATYGVHASLTQPPHGLTLTLTSDVGMPFAGRAVTALMSALDEVAAGRVSPGELDRLKLSWARSTVTRWQSAPELASWLADVATADLAPDIGLQLAEQLHALTPHDLASALGDCVGHEFVSVQGAATPAAMALDSAEIAYGVR